MATIRGRELGGSPSTAARRRRARRRPARRAPRRAAAAAGRRGAPAPAGGRRAPRIRLSSEPARAQAGLDAVAQLDVAEHGEAARRPPRSPARPSAPAAPPWRSCHASASTRARTPRTPPRAASSARAALARERAQRSPARAGGGASARGASGSTNVTFSPPRARARRTGTGRRSGSRAPAIASASGVRKCRSTARLSGRAPRSGVKPCGEQELQRRVVELDRPLAPAQPAPREHRLQLGREDLAHHRPRQRPEDDRAVDPVEELGPERARDRLLDTLRRGEPASTGENPTPRRSRPSRRGSRS